VDAARGRDPRVAPVPGPQVCDYLGLPKEKVLTHWACLKLRSGRSRDLTDAQLEKLIVDKVRRPPHVLILSFKKRVSAVHHAPFFFSSSLRI